MTPSDFIAQIGPGAHQSNIDTGIPASITLAQAALESGWGESGLAMQSKNLFGIKADASWTGPKSLWPTEEWSAEQGWYETQAAFRDYPDWAASLDDHAKFFFQNSRYAPALAVRGDSNAWARQIQACGYATDPNYAEQLMRIAQQFNLYFWDVPQTQWQLLSWAKA